MSARVHLRLREWEAIDPRHPNGAAARGLCLPDSGTRAQAELLSRTGMLDITELQQGLLVRATSFVGRVELGNIAITVDPKLQSSELLELLRYAFELRNLKLLSEARFATTGEVLQDLFVAQLLAETDELVRAGLARRYVRREEALSNPRGRLDVQKLARAWPLLRPELPCRHYVRDCDHLLNRVLVAGLRLAKGLCQSPALRSAVAMRIRSLPAEIGVIHLDAQSLGRARASMDRLVEAYRPAIDLIALLYACTAMSFDEERTTALPGFLFDMNRFFQALVGRLLEEHLPNAVVRREHVLTGVMRYLPEANPRRRRDPLPRPDFVVESARGTFVLDAKYRDLWERELPRDMLYQLGIYALTHPSTNAAAIIYPCLTETAREAVIDIRDPLGGTSRGRVVLRPLPIQLLARSLRLPGAEQVLAEIASRVAAGGATLSF